MKGTWWARHEPSVLCPSTVLGPGPAFRAAQDDHRPDRPRGIARAGLFLDGADLGEGRVERRRHGLVHDRRVVAFDEDRRIAIAAQQRVELGMADAREHRRIGDLEAVQMQDRQDCAIGRRIEEFIAVPSGGERAGLGFAVADDAGRDQAWIVEHRAISMRKRIAEFAALMDRARRIGRRMARNSARKGKLPEEAAHAVFILRDLRIEFAIGPLQPAIGNDARRAMARPGDEKHVEAARLDDAVQMDIEKIEAGYRAPMPEQARLHMRHFQRFAQERIVEKIDLSDRKIIRGAPPGVHEIEFGLRQRCGCVGHVNNTSRHRMTSSKKSPPGGGGSAK